MIDPDRLAALIQHLAEGRRSATEPEAVQFRAWFAEHGLPSDVNSRVRLKYEQHVLEGAEWPNDTTPKEYLESLRATVRDVRSGIYATFEVELDDWIIYFVGRVRRPWRGLRAGQRIVVLFRRDPQRWITGFQARDGHVYVENQEGSWLFRPR